MNKVIVEHKVKDFNSWKKVFDNSTDMITDHGGRNFSVNRNHDSPNDVYIVADFDKKENFDSMWQSTELKNALKDSGVISEPKVTILDEKSRG